jgi:hypothetical protein
MDGREEHVACSRETMPISLSEPGYFQPVEAGYRDGAEAPPETVSPPTFAVFFM